MERLIDHFYIFSTIIFAVYSQLVMRWQVLAAGELPVDLNGKFYFIVKLLFNPWVISSIVSTFISGVFWMLAMSKFDISYAYPWVSLIFIFMFVFGVVLFDESFNLFKLMGSLLVVAGLITISRS
jgi:multidrug transporter EmrE-like cation transporter